MPKRNKVLITGSGGMLGSDLWKELSKGYELYGIDVHRVQGTLRAYRPVGPEAGFRVQKYFPCDITDKKIILKLVEKISPDVVIHTAAWTDVDGCEFDKKKAYRINVQGTKNIASACKASGATLIYISTDFVFDGKKKKPYRETDRPHPISIYGDSKLKGEEAVKKTLKKYFILRTSWLYGKHGKNFVDTILVKTRSEDTLKVVDDQIGSPTYTKDLAKAMHVLLDKIRVQGTGFRVQGSGIYNLSNSGSVSWYEYTKEILRLAGCKTEVRPISSEELSRPARRPAMSVLDNSKFVKFTGFRMREWKLALREYLKRENKGKIGEDREK